MKILCVISSRADAKGKEEEGEPSSGSPKYRSLYGGIFNSPPPPQAVLRSRSRYFLVGAGAGVKMWRQKHFFNYFLAYFYMKRSRSRWKKSTWSRSRSKKDRLRNTVNPTANRSGSDWIRIFNPSFLTKVLFPGGKNNQHQGWEAIKRQHQSKSNNVENPVILKWISGLSFGDFFFNKFRQTRSNQDPEFCFTLPEI